MNWTPPAHWTRITSIDAHTAGEPLRILTGGIPPIPGNTMPAKRRYAQTHLDDLRRAVVWEPRGHADMYGAILTDPVTADGDHGVLFLHNEGWSTMCGHGVIALVQVGLNTGLIQAEGDRPVVRLDTPAGRVTATAHRSDGRVTHVSFRNVPSYVVALDQQLDIDGIGRIHYDIAFGGAYYAFVQAADVGLSLTPDHARDLIDAGTRIKAAVSAAHPFSHPTEPDLAFIYGTIFVGPAMASVARSRNVCVFADGEVDRSPTGTGVSARAAIHYARNELALGEPFVVESILGTTFTGVAVEEVTFGGQPAVIPQVTGSAAVVGQSEWFIDPADPLSAGFLIR
jgi:trans-L-3-hydroxyproline dehydratase